MECFFRHGKKTTMIFEMLNQVYGEEVVLRAFISEWRKQFSEGRDKVWFDSQPERLTTSKSDENIKKVRTLVWNYWHLAIRMIAEELNINRETVQFNLMENLGMKNVRAKMVPKNLTNNQMEWMRKVYADFLQ
jgi:hypothetical protein